MKIKKKIWGGGGGCIGGMVRVDVNEELKLLCKLKKKHFFFWDGGGGGVGVKSLGWGGGGSGWM